MCYTSNIICKFLINYIIIIYFKCFKEGIIITGIIMGNIKNIINR